MEKAKILNKRQLSDLEMLAIGAFAPLEGFLKREDYTSVVDRMRLADGRPWPIPITLSTTTEEAVAYAVGDALRLLGEDGVWYATLDVEDIFPYDKKREAKMVYDTTDEAHPGVAVVYQQGDVLLGGKVRIEKRPVSNDFAERRMDPVDTKIYFQKKGWKTVVGFQTRNPIHRAHEYIIRCALECVDGLFLHPLVGETKSGDVPADVRMRCYDALVQNVFPADRVLLAINPAAMRYAGPREAIFHALIRKNYGCTHFIVGRDHAGVGKYYGPFDAQKIFSEFQAGELGITPMMFDASFFCRTCGCYATAKTCAHPAAARVELSGTQMRAMLSAGELPPPEFTRPEIAHILMEAYRI